jgi:hypothetical protein
MDASMLDRCGGRPLALATTSVTAAQPAARLVCQQSCRNLRLRSRPRSLQSDAFKCSGFISKYLQTDPEEGRYLLASLLGWIDDNGIPDARADALDRYVDALPEPESPASGHGRSRKAARRL